jgi:hypothetical protein
MAIEQGPVISTTSIDRGPRPLERAVPRRSPIERNSRRPSPRSSVARSSVAPWPLALCGAALLTALYFQLGQGALVQDGPLLLQELVNQSSPTPLWIHAAVFPLARALLALFPGIEPLTSLALVSALAGAAGVIVTALAVRRVAGPQATLATAALVATCPALVVHASLVEVHSQQFLGAALLALALVTLLEVGPEIPRRARVLALWLCCAALAVLLHRANALPLLALAGAAAWQARGADRLRGLAGWRLAVICGSGAVGAGALLIAAQWSVGREHGGGLGQSLWLLREFLGVPSAEFVARELLLGQGLVLCCGALGLALVRPPLRGLAATAAAAVLLIFALFAVVTEGGYFLGATPFLALGVATCVERCRASWSLSTAGLACATAVLVLGQGTLAVGLSRTAEEAELAAWARARLAALATLPQRERLLLSADASLQLLSGRGLPLVERPLWHELYLAASTGTPPQSFCAAAEQQLQPLLASSSVEVVLDWNWRRYLARRPEIEPYLTALGAHAQSHWGAQLYESGGLEFLLLPSAATFAPSADR